MLNEPVVDEKKGLRRGKCRAKGISERERESLTAGPDQGQCGWMGGWISSGLGNDIREEIYKYVIVLQKKRRRSRWK